MAAFAANVGFEARLTGTRFASFANVAPLYIYCLENGKFGMGSTLRRSPGVRSFLR